MVPDISSVSIDGPHPSTALGTYTGSVMASAPAISSEESSLAGTGSRVAPGPFCAPPPHPGAPGFVVVVYFWLVTLILSFVSHPLYQITQVITKGIIFTFG